MEQLQKIAQLADPPRTISAAAMRQRLSRQRRRDGTRCVPLEIRTTEVEALIAGGWLAAADQNNREAVATALGVMLDELQLGHRSSADRRMIPVNVPDAGIAYLVERGWLPAAEQDKRPAVANAICGLLMKLVTLARPSPAPMPTR